MIPTLRTCALLLLALAAIAPGGLAADPGTEEALTLRVQALTAADLAGRGSGTPESAATVALLESWLKELGLEPGFSSGWRQEFPLKGEGWNGEDLAGQVGVNVAGLLPGAGALAGRYLIVGAHHDHLGRLAGADPHAVPEPGQYYPGANDNASGLAALVEMAALLAAGESPPSRRGVLVVCFAAEEIGLQGSAHFVAHPPVALGQVDAMINFDTVGQMTDRRLHVSGIGTAAELPVLVNEANHDGLQLSLARGGWSGSDHMSFNTREVPVLFLFGGPYTQYNTPEDTWDTLNYEGLRLITLYAARLVRGLDTMPEPLEWVMVAESQLRQDDAGEQDRRSWLGTLPDFTEEISGYKLAGVFEGSPAARAGLLKGDVMISMAGLEVTDLATFTRALRSGSPGDLVEITVLRQGKTLNFTVVLGDRKDRR